MVAALEQSAGAWLPEIHGECDVATAAAALGEMPRLLLDLGGASMLGVPYAGAVALLVGPEGGIEPEELATLERVGWQRVALGATTLRFETAAVAATAVARAALEAGALDFRTEG
jgi:16S rRNA (uracil1498-N3)-methyltransferase